MKKIKIFVSLITILESVKKKQFPDLIGKGFKILPVKKPGKKEAEENNYKRQLQKYMKILKEIYPDKSINGVIAYVDLVEVRFVSI